MKKVILIFPLISAFFLPCKLFAFPGLNKQSPFPYTDVPESSLSEICRQYMEDLAPAPVFPRTEFFPYYDEATKLYGFVDTKDNVVIPAKYDRPGDFYTVLRGMNSGKSYAVVQEKTGKFGVIDEKGKTVIPFKYDKITLSYADRGNALIAEGLRKKTKTRFGLYRDGSSGGNGNHPVIGFGFYEDIEKYFSIWNMTSGKPILKNDLAEDGSYYDGYWSVWAPPAPFILMEKHQHHVQSFLGAFDSNGKLHIYHFVRQQNDGRKQGCYLHPSDIRKCLGISSPFGSPEKSVKKTANPNIVLIGHAKTEKGENDLQSNRFEENNGDIDWTFYDTGNKTEFPIPFKKYKILENPPRSWIFSVVSIHGEETK